MGFQNVESLISQEEGPAICPPDMVPGRRVRNLALSFSANAPRAAPVPRLIAVSRAYGQVVSCARAPARNFSRRGR